MSIEARKFYTLSADNEITYLNPIGEVIWMAFLWITGYSFLALGILNVFFIRPMPVAGIIASLIWIGAMSIGLLYDCRRIGVRQHLISLLGCFIRNRFVQFVRDDSGVALLCIGYKFRSKRMFFLKVQATGINKVDWGMGQASGIAGKDMNDWSVAMWFKGDAIVYNRKGNDLRLYIVGPPGRRDRIEEFGNTFIDFLKSNGVEIDLPPQDLIGRHGEVSMTLGFSAKIIVDGNEYHAQPVGRKLKEGTPIIVSEVRGTSVHIKEAEGDA